MAETKRRVAVVDYGMCNLFSVQRACEHVGLASFVTSDPAAVRTADAAILPGVGAFGEGMRNMVQRGLDDALRDLVARGRPLLGICLGMQMILSQSEEFGDHRGLDLVPGRVVKFALSPGNPGRIRVPQIGWNRLVAPAGYPGCWADTPLQGVADGEYMYFVHSFYAVPRDPGVVLSRTTYSGIEYCSSFRKDRIYATQFHPEKSGPAGIMIYRNFKSFCDE